MTLYLHHGTRAIPIRKSRRLTKNFGFYDTSKQEIVVDATITGQKAIEIYIHEMLHAIYPDLSEEAVADGAESMAAVLDQEEVRSQTDA